MNALSLFFLCIFFWAGCGGDSDRRDRGQGRRGDTCPSANLSEEQKNFIKQLRQDSKQNHQNLSEEQRKTQKGQINQRILNETPSLTPEQKQALSECFNSRRSTAPSNEN